MKTPAQPKVTRADRETINESLQRFYFDPENGAIRAIAEMIDAFDLSGELPEQVRPINPYAAKRVLTAFKMYLRGSTSLDNALGLRSAGRGSRGAGTRYRQAQVQCRVMFDYLVARESGKTYEEALGVVASLHDVSPETVRRLTKK